MAPNITEYTNEQAVNPAPVEGAAYSLERYGRINQESIQQGFSGLADVAKAYEKHQARSEVMAYQNDASKYEVQKTQEYEAKRAAAGNDTSWVPGWLDEYKKGLDDLADKPATELAQDFARNHASEQYRSVGQKVFSEAANTEAAKQVSDAHETVNNLANLAATDWHSTANYAARAAYAATFVPGEARGKEITHAMNTVYDSGIESAVSQAEGDPNATPESIQTLTDFLKDPKNGYTDNTSDGKYAQAMARLNNLRQFRQKAQFSQDEAFLDDGFKQMRENGGFDNDNRIKAAIEGHVGGNAEETAKWQTEKQNEYRKAQAYGQEAKVINALPKAAASDHVADLENELNTAPLEEAGPARERYDAAQAIIKQRDAAVLGDKGLKAADYFSDARNFRSNYILLNNAINSKDPADWQKYFGAMNTTQQTLYPGEVPKVLPSFMRDNIAQRLNNVPTTPEGATQAAATLQELYKTTGPQYWMQAVHELQSTGVLKPGQYTAALMFQRPESMALAQEVLRATSLPKADLDALSAGKVSEGQARAAAANALGDLHDTLKDNFDGGSTVASFTDALAAVMRARGSIKDADALAHQMITGQFQIRNGLRIPNNVDAGSVTNMTARVQADVGKLNLAVPSSYSGLGPVGQREQYGRYIASNGHWSTNTAGDGAMLFAPDGTPVYATGKNGKPQQVEVKWKDVQNGDQPWWDRMKGNPAPAHSNTAPAAPAAPAPAAPAPAKASKASAGGWSAVVAD